jgi:glutamine transport system substrate-binding protein
MKKISILSLFFILSLILSACGTSQTGGEKEMSGSSGSVDEKKKLKVATDANYAPFEYMDKGEIVGFDVDFVKAVAEEAGYEVEIVNVGWDPLFVEIKDKISDVGMSAITITKERKQTYDFSVPYFLSTNKILVPKGSDIKSAADLKDKIVAVQNGAID